jgi:PPOX class probable F420-dependent enzyme
MSDAELQVSPEVAKRLRQEQIIWFTTVSPKGIPTPNPVWFYWDGADFLVYSQPESFRVRNIQGNPHVALTLQGVDGLGNNVVIISGEAQLTFDNQRIPDGYWNKFKQLLQNDTPEEMTASYNVEIRVRPTKIRTA